MYGHRPLLICVTRRQRSRAPRTVSLLAATRLPARLVLRAEATATKGLTTVLTLSRALRRRAALPRLVAVEVDPALPAHLRTVCMLLSLCDPTPATRSLLVSLRQERRDARASRLVSRPGIGLDSRLGDDPPWR
jgi:hypothetical protein